MYRKRDRISIGGREINSSSFLINWWISESANKIESFLIASDYEAVWAEKHFNFHDSLELVMRGAEIFGILREARVKLIGKALTATFSCSITTTAEAGEKFSSVLCAINFKVSNYLFVRQLMELGERL